MVFRKKESEGFELRTLDLGGNGGEGSIQLDIPARLKPTFSEGRSRRVPSSNNKLKFSLHPWRTNTIEIL
jgi:hypothetical protein